MTILECLSYFTSIFLALYTNCSLILEQSLQYYISIALPGFAALSHMLATYSTVQQEC